MLDANTIAFKGILSLNSLSNLLVLVLEFFGLFDELFNFILGESTLIVSNGDLFGFGSALIGSMDTHDTVLVNLERNLNLGNSSRGRRDAIKIKFPKNVIVLSHLSLPLEDLDQDSRLVVCVGGKGL